MIMPLYLILSLIFIAAASLTAFGLLRFHERRQSGTQRFKKVENSSDSLNWKNSLIESPISEQANLPQKAEKLLTKMGRFGKNNDKDAKHKSSLMQAGFYQQNSVRIFLSLKLVCATFLFSIYTGLGLLSGKSFSAIFLMGLLFAFMGYMFPRLFLMTKIRRRQEAIAGGLSDALDFLVICVEAGLGLNSALVRVGTEIKLRCKALGEELLMVNQEMRTGAPREQALRNLSERNRVKDLKALTSAILLSDRLGTNLSDTLRTQSDFLRTRVLQRAEEKAAKSSIKLLFPLVFFLMPALFVVILGPGIILVIKTFGPIF